MENKAKPKLKIGDAYTKGEQQNYDEDGNLMRFQDISHTDPKKTLTEEDDEDEMAFMEMAQR